jgi:DNA-damage-inducible protein J
MRLARRSTIRLHLGMPAKESYVRARVDDRLKRDTELILHELGLTTTEAIRIFLHQVRRHKGLPFDLRLKEDNSDILLPVATRQSALDSVYDD